MSLSYNPTVANDGLVLYLDFNNSNTYAGTGNTSFDLISSKTYTLVSSPTFDSTGPKCFSLNGSTHYFSGNMNQLNFGTGDFTIQANIKLNGLSNGFTGAYAAAFVCAAAGSTGSCLLQVGGGSTSYTNIGIYHETTGILSSINYNFSTNIIYNVAVARASGVLTAYVNGTAIGSTTTTNLYDFNKGGNLLGRHYFAGYEQYFKGNVYSLQAYSRSLSSTEILQNYNATKKRFLPEENIVGNGIVLNLDPAKSNSYSGIGNTIFDLSGIGNTGTLINGPTFSSLNGGSIVFDGTNDFLTIGDKLDFGFNSFSFSCWINLSSVTGTRCVFSKSVADYQPYRYALLIINNKLRPFMRGNLIDLDVEFDSTLSLSTSTWYHIVCVYERSSTLKLYINSSLDSSASISHWQNLDIQNSYTFKLGSYAAPDDSATYFMQGYISNFTAYNRVLSSTEILQNYNAVKNRFGLS